MMRLIKLSWLLGLSIGLNAVSFGKTDLMTAYRDAVMHDPRFKEAKATWLINQESLAITRADLLPTITTGASLLRSGYEQDGSKYKNTTQAGHTNEFAWKLSLNQPLFDLSKVFMFAQAKSNVKAAYVEFLAEEANLLYRIAERYLAVLYRKDCLQWAQANKISTQRLLDQAQHKYEVGLVSVTELEDAKRAYSKAAAEEIGAANNVSIALEQMAEYTGVVYSDVNILKEQFPLISPNPANIEAWVKIVEQRNYALSSAKYQCLAAKDVINVQRSEHLPTVNAVLDYSQSTSETKYQEPVNGALLNARDSGLSGGVKAQWVLFAGGKVSAAVQQAIFKYQKTASARDRVHREVVSNTRQSYLNILSYISKIKANAQAIRAAESALKATYASYTVGKRTMTDVLDKQTALYNAQLEFANDEYIYIRSFLQLKQLASLLQEADLKILNAQMTSEVPKLRSFDVLKAEIEQEVHS